MNTRSRGIPLTTTIQSNTKRLILLGLFLWALGILAPASTKAQDPAAPAPAAPAPAAPAAPPAYLNVVSTVPVPGATMTIAITFDKPVALPANPDGTQPIPVTFEPPLEGDGRIEANTVIYTTKAIPQGEYTIYKMTLNPALTSTDGLKLNPDQQTFNVANFALECLRLWILESTAESTKLGALFPAPVKPEDLAAHLAVVKSGSAIAGVQVLQGTNDNTLNIVIPGPADPTLMLNVSAGLPEASGRIIGQEKVYPFPVTPLNVKEIDWEHYSWQEQSIRLVFSAQVSRERLQSALAITGESGEPLPYQLVSDDVSDVQIALLEAQQTCPKSVNINIADGLLGAANEGLASPYKTTLHGRTFQLSIDQTYWQESWENNGREGGFFYVNLNMPIKTEDLRSNVELEPPIENMRIEARYSGFRIYGDWNSKQRYIMRIKAGLQGPGGEVLPAPITQELVSGHVPGYVGFSHEGEYYFPRRGGMSLPLETRNVDNLEITLNRMFPSNIMVALTAMENGRGSSYFNESWSEEVAKTELPVVGQADRIVQTPVDLDSLFPQDKLGVFCLEAKGKTPSYITRYNDDGEETGEEDIQYEERSSTKIVLWTNMGVLSHWQKDELVAFVHDLYSLAPTPFAKATVYSTKNQVLATGNTDERGIARFSAFNTALGQPRVLTVEKDGDFTFLELQTREDDAKEFTEQMPAYDRKGYDAFIYADRDLYRPGETIHAHWIVRTNNGDAVPDLPLLLNVIKPNGRNLLSQPVILSPLGTGGLDVTTEKAYPTGKYTVELTIPGSKKAIGTYQFSLEEFVPNRIKAEVKLDTPVLLSGQSYPVIVNAQHLFGAPASGRGSEMIVILRREPVKLEGWKEYTFFNDSEYIPEPVQLGQLTTDQDGNASFTFVYEAPKQVTTPLKAIAVGRVFELGGRPVSGKAEATFFPSDTCLGISAAQAASGTGLDVFAAAVKPDGSVAPLDKVNITLERRVWNYYVRRYYGYNEPKWSESFEPVETREVALVDGRAQTTFTPSGYGYFRVRVHSPATPQYSTMSFYCYGGQAEAVDSARPNLLKVKLDKQNYTVGQEAQVRVESPFDGKGVVVIQGENIYDLIPVDIVDKVGIVKFMVTPDHFPNVWLEATVIHAIKTDTKQVYPFSSFAMTNLAVNDPKRELSVTFANLPEEIRPATEAQFEIDVCGAEGGPTEAEVTLAAVDEGIHGISGYQSPDPYAWLARSRQPDFRRAHYYDKVAYDFLKPQIGGDALLRDLQKRLPSVDENWIKPVALWSGVVQTDPYGRAVVKMAIPEFTGQLRLVAVACTSTSLGAHSGNIYVRRPYMLRTSVPRFMLPGDTAKCRVAVFNNSDAPCKAKVTWSCGGTIQSGTGSAELDVAPHAEANALAEFVAGQAIGQGEFRWEAEFFDASGQSLEKLTQTAPMPVRTPATYQTAFDVYVVKPGETREIRNTMFLDDARAEIDIAVGLTPLIKLRDAFRYLVGYPYGCVEQTTSKLMPMYLLKQSKDAFAGTLDPSDTLENYIQTGINRLFSMQTTKGGLGYWPGNNKPYPHGSVYALHFLTTVKRGRDFAMPEDNFKQLQEYVRQLVMNWNDKSPADLATRAYALYVLALDGDLWAIQQIPRFDTIDIPRHSRYLLAAALAMNTQDQDRIKMYLANSPCSPYTVHETSGTLNSEIRNDAIELLALLQMKAPSEQTGPLATKLADYLSKQRYYYTSHDLAFCASALGEYFAGVNADPSTASAAITTPRGQETFSGQGVFRASHEGPAGVFTVANTGGIDLHVSTTTAGIPQNPDLNPIAEGGLTVSRYYMTSDGKPFEGNTFKQGSSYIVALKLDVAGRLENIVAVDLLPAGLEIENPRLQERALPPGIEEKGITASYLDVRDDRLVTAFDELEEGTHRFYYVVRAVTPGTYDHPGATAECMYDAKVRSRSPSGQAIVQE